ncbi:sigma-54-dependent transcriptional regulator [Thiopseudomonas acetoxidans]|uniref:Sigma-54 dependent transcriptional regulator n=1 Tax=Thiopseudomonas acetoxidans TaxID=3041622 RepID=A0ABT7SQW4_9GAMM|nr:sigma-54 dependent transcriptional regulator [Thiopseudomonas sp. CY1220]MDM7858580.1 sigma-54 dependent transcriptional regulator [Thiopseudomonas sp. CY1220]
MPHILIVEDEPIIRSALKRLLERNGYQTSEAGSVQEAQPLLAANEFDLIVSDLRLPSAPGTEMIKLAGEIPVLIMTSYASLRSAVDSMKLGAIDYIAKPFEHDDMLQSIARILQERQQQPDPADTVKTSSCDNSDLGIIGSSPGMLTLFDKIRKVAPTDSNVLIQGESGTGKELVARALHRLSKRAQEPIISVNCAAIPESLIESELFGHEKGAFTGADRARAGLVEAAHGGTLFLDEIGELPLEAQARLLRVLQEGEIRRVGSVQSQKVDIRLIAATHRDLKSLSQSGQFREDLYYRLHVIALNLPALRERGDDIIEIAKALLEQQRLRLGREPMKFSKQTLTTLEKYPWPGNVRELENAIERAVILCEGTEINTELLGIDVEIKHSNVEEETSSSNTDPSMEGYFQRFVLEHQDHMTETDLASKLGISRKSLWERRQRLGIPRKKGSKSDST